MVEHVDQPTSHAQQARVSPHVANDEARDGVRAGPVLRYLLLLTVAATFALVVLGGIVRITGSGLGCPDWPQCHGQWIPPLQGAILIEYSHRLAASLVSVLLLGSAALAVWRYRRDRMIIGPIALALVLLVIQILLGAVTVLWELPPAVVVVHLAVAMLILAALCVATLAAWAGWPQRLPRADGLARLAVWTSAGTYLLVLTGALVASTYAGYACPDLPLCQGYALPPENNPLGRIHMLHRYAAMAGAGLVLYTAWRAWRIRRQSRPIMWAAGLAALLVTVQIGLGVGMVITVLGTEWIRAAHLLAGSAIWVSMVLLATMAVRFGRPQRHERRPTMTSKRGTSVESTPTTAATIDANAANWRTVINDYVTLTKPRIIVLLLLTTLAAMFLAAEAPLSVWLVLWTMLGGALAAGGANAINMYMDRDVDALMGRTSRRPVPSSRIKPRNALIFGLLLNALAFVVLTWGANLLAAALAIGGTAYYVLVYTRLLKRSTHHNIVIGGAAGAMPPLVGWAAVTGRLDLGAILLFAIIFYWTPPHFWALALLRRADYARAGIPMLPVAKGEAETKWQILLYTIMMIAVSVLPTSMRIMGPLYMVVALLLGGLFLHYAIRLFRESGTSNAWSLYKYSLLYLALLFGAMVLDRMAMMAVGA